MVSQNPSFLMRTYYFYFLGLHRVCDNVKLKLGLLVIKQNNSWRQALSVKSYFSNESSQTYYVGEFDPFK